MSEFAAPALVAIALGSSIYQGVAAADAREKASREADQRRAEQAKMLEDQKAEKKLEQDKLAAQEAQRASEAANLATRDASRAKQKALAAGAGGRSDTILTSPLGVQEDPNVQGKTLLGA